MRGGGEAENAGDAGVRGCATRVHRRPPGATPRPGLPTTGNRLGAGCCQVPGRPRLTGAGLRQGGPDGGLLTPGPGTDIGGRDPQSVGGLRSRRDATPPCRDARGAACLRCRMRAVSRSCGGAVVCSYGGAVLRSYGGAVMCRAVVPCGAPRRRAPGMPQVADAWRQEQNSALRIGRISSARQSPL